MKTFIVMTVWTMLFVGTLLQCIAQPSVEYQKEQEALNIEHENCRKRCFETFAKGTVGRLDEWSCDGTGSKGPESDYEICGCNCDSADKLKRKQLFDKYLPLLQKEERENNQNFQAAVNPNLELRPTYEKTAQAYLEAASKTKCPERKTFLTKAAEFYNCTAANLGGIGNGNCGVEPNLANIPPCPEDAGNSTSSAITKEETNTNNSNNNINNTNQLGEVLTNPSLRQNQLIGGQDGFMTYGQAEDLGNALADLSSNMAAKKQSKRDAERDYENEKLYGFTVTQYRYAVEKGDTATVSKMLNKGMSINTEITGFFYSLNGLHLASMNGNVTMCNFFLERGMDINVMNTENYWAEIGQWTPLFFAIDDNRIDCVKFLLSKGANPYHSIHPLTRMKKLNARQYAKWRRFYYIERILIDWEKTHPKN